MEELLLITEQMQDELDQKDQTIMEPNRQLSRLLTLNEKLNSESRAENIGALQTRLRQTEKQLTSETDSRKRADAEVVVWKFKYEIFLITGILIIWIGYQVGKIYRKYCWDILSIMVALISIAIAIYFGVFIISPHIMFP